jgi:putative oxidoreductase
MNPMDASSISSDQAVASPQFPMHRDPESARWDIDAWEAAQRDEKVEVKRHRAAVYLAGRALIGLLFIAAAIFKITHFGSVVPVLGARGVSDTSAVLFIAVATELVGGLLLLIGFRVRFAAYGLIGYLFGISVLLNWNLAVEVNRSMVFANVGFAAGLLLLAANGAGIKSLDGVLARRLRISAR